jgi:hypothetical protein
LPACPNYFIPWYDYGVPFVYNIPPSLAYGLPRLVPYKDGSTWGVWEEDKGDIHDELIITQYLLG